MIDDGVVKFNFDWHPEPLEFVPEVLIEARNFLHQKKWIGTYPDGIGYGNISIRSAKGFYISSSATGDIAQAQSKDFSEVRSWDIASNQLSCYGLKIASSESLTHAALYDTMDNLMSVIHIHNNKLYQHHYNIVDTTPNTIAYGTPEMAYAIQQVALKKGVSGCVIMGGHPDGILSWGPDLESCLHQLLTLENPL
jgi:ribulose-5-phosphate 4-epimerase/fuculose-1-phosphate aldolase